MTVRSNTFLFARGLIGQPPDVPFLGCPHGGSNHVTRPCPIRSEHVSRQGHVSSVSASQSTGVPLIYAVDDAPDLTELYAAVLEPAGFIVRTFNDRAKALTALKADRVKPDLLITDYLGRSMPVDRFIGNCLNVHPALRILMASGWHNAKAMVPQVNPDRFLQKPFTLEELRQEVRAALIASRISGF